ncbi:MAG TPA: GNAT family N-acetyltransferase [Steroidobacteraceae bacterium]|jgi:GNAT superfamily N-acetyltransferase|nr:GNAT family N-acetyltransferase [Steroidobacteraceae bacterium]
MSEYGAIEKLKREHLLDGFDCGKKDLNRFLKRQAWNNEQAHSAQTYVLAKELTVYGYYSLAASSLTHDEATERVKKGLARHPIPVILLARLAEDVSFQGKGVGPALLKDALLRVASAADTVGARALLVHAKGDNAKGFYQHFDFEPSQSDPYHLLLIMKDLLRMVGK